MKDVVIFIFFLLLFPTGVFAYETVQVTQPSPFEISELKDVTTEQWFVGELNDFPHTFEFLLTEPTMIRAERGVTEVMRRTLDKVEWSDFKDTVSGLHFSESTLFNEQLEPGVYRIEVSNPKNIGRYVLKLGYEDDHGGYFNTLKDIKTLRNGMGKSTFGMVVNKYVYIPLFALFTLIFFVWFWYKKKR